MPASWLTVIKTAFCQMPKESLDLTTSRYRASETNYPEFAAGIKPHAAANPSGLSRSTARELDARNCGAARRLSAFRQSARRDEVEHGFLFFWIDRMKARGFCPFHCENRLHLAIC